MTYSEKLRDPRWQKKRLEIMNRDGFKCRDCGSDVITLSVHHHRYKANAEPWEYPAHDLGTFCQPCHDARHAQLKLLRTAIECFASQLTAAEIERFYTALMFKGDALEAIMKIVKGEK